MASLARALAILGAISGVAGVAATVANHGTSDLVASLESAWRDAFALSPWHLAPVITCGLIGAALVATVVEKVVPTGASAVRGRRSSGAATVADIVREVAADLDRTVVQRLRKNADPDTIVACESLIRGAIRVEASDLHISPTPESTDITYRVHGEIVDVIRLPTAALAPLTARLKVMSKLDTYVRQKPQDGRLSLELDGKAIEARVSTLPTEAGERVVLRFVRGGRAVPEITGLGFSKEVEEGLKSILSKPQGLLFVTGPVGSGKTTTLYSSLAHIAQNRGRTTTQVTLEDPIEIELAFATQTQINPKAGMTFAGALRSVLRQDPNVLMVGEIRDRETAEIAMQAGLTGHLILTTVHGSSSAGVFARLIEMGIEPFLLSSAVVGSLSQRLVRLLCLECRREMRPDEATRDRFRKGGVELGEGTYFEAIGCASCDNQGYTGRLPIGELLVMNEAIQRAVRERAPAGEIEQLAVSGGMTRLLTSGVAAARRGETSLIEIMRVAG